MVERMIVKVSNREKTVDPLVLSGFLNNNITMTTFQTNKYV